VLTDVLLFFIQVLLKQFLLDLFKHPRQELSDDEKEEVEEEEKEEQEDSDDKEANSGSKSTRSERARKKKEEKKEKEKQQGVTPKKEKEITEADVKVALNKDGRRTPQHARDMHPDESYSHMMCNNNWYIFLRLHHILCERLTKMYNQAVIIANEESNEKKERKESTAIALRLKPKSKTSIPLPAFFPFLSRWFFLPSFGFIFLISLPRTVCLSLRSALQQQRHRSAQPTKQPPDDGLGDRRLRRRQQQRPEQPLFRLFQPTFFLLSSL
jgi:hypothetical protein